MVGRSKKCIEHLKTGRHTYIAHNKGKICITNGIHNRHINKNEAVPVNWWRGNNRKSGDLKNEK